MDVHLGQPLIGSRPTVRAILSGQICRSRALAHPGWKPLTQRTQRQGFACRAAETEKAEQSQQATPQPQKESAPGNWIPVCLPEEVPKGYRREVVADGVEVLLLWYRNQIYAIEARSPAEGAYSEGFVNGRLNQGGFTGCIAKSETHAAQDYCIACPSTGTLFSLKTGEIVDWYPNNPVLRAITPKSLCRKLDIFPVKLTQEAISVDVSGAAANVSASAGKGGSDTSIDANNVFGVESRPYYETQNPITGEIDQEAANRINPYVIGVSFFAVVFAGVAGSAFAIYKESYIGLGALWVGILALAVYSVSNYTPLGKKNK